MSGVRIALFLMSGNNDYQRLLEEDCLAAARRRNGVVQVFSANLNHDTQEEQIRAVLSQPPQQRPQVCIVSPVRETSLRPVAREAVSAGIGWVLLTRWSDHVNVLRQEFSWLPIFAVSADQHEVGRIQASQIKLLMPRGGEVVSIRGTLGTSSSQRRFSALKDEFGDAPFNLVPLNSDWTTNGGARAMAEWLQLFPRGKLPEFAVAAQNDRMALGARRALLEWAVARKLSCQRIPFTGCDGLATHGQRLVSEGELSATVVVPSVATRAVEEILAMQQTGRAPAAEILVRVSSYPVLDELERVARAKTT